MAIWLSHKLSSQLVQAVLCRAVVAQIVNGWPCWNQSSNGYCQHSARCAWCWWYIRAAQQQQFFLAGHNQVCVEWEGERGSGIYGSTYLAPSHVTAGNTPSIQHVHVYSRSHSRTFNMTCSVSAAHQGLHAIDHGGTCTWKVKHIGCC